VAVITGKERERAKDICFFLLLFALIYIYIVTEQQSVGIYLLSKSIETEKKTIGRGGKEREK